MAGPHRGHLTFSVVICTDGRSTSLANTLHSLRYLEGGPFEICVVRGPTEDGIEDVLGEWAGLIKMANTPERNLSAARNLGIALSAGEIIAFLDDDAVPEQEWLDQLGTAFEDPRVGAAGGVVYDHTGKAVQYLCCSANRLGIADYTRTTSAEHFSFPYSFNFPYVAGTNCAFRRTALQSCGGFDQEFAYHLDETDVCCRLVDRGWHIRQLPNAFVHHKTLPSLVRTDNRIFRSWYQIIKNKIYFSLVNGRNHKDMHVIVEDALRFVDQMRAHVEWATSQGYLNEDDGGRFAQEVDRAWRDGLRRGLAGRRLLATDKLLPPPCGSFLPFQPFPCQPGRLTICVVTPDYNDRGPGNIGCSMRRLAKGLAALGHHVHVLTAGTGHDRLDFEEDVWVHRIVVRGAERPVPQEYVCAPVANWDFAVTMFNEFKEIASKRPVHAVYSPLYGRGGAAFLAAKYSSLITGLFDSADLPSPDQPDPAGEHLLRHSQAIHAMTSSALTEVALSYRTFVVRATIVPLNLGDAPGSAQALMHAIQSTLLRLRPGPPAAVAAQ